MDRGGGGTAHQEGGRRPAISPSFTARTDHRDPLVEQFRRRKIPFAIRGLSILSTVILRDLIAYLNIIHSAHDNVSLTRVLLTPRWNFPEELALGSTQAGVTRPLLAL